MDRYSNLVYWHGWLDGGRGDQRGLTITRIDAAGKVHADDDFGKKLGTVELAPARFGDGAQLGRERRHGFARHMPHVSNRNGNARSRRWIGSDCWCAGVLSAQRETVECVQCIAVRARAIDRLRVLGTVGRDELIERVRRILAGWGCPDRLQVEPGFAPDTPGM